MHDTPGSLHKTPRPVLCVLGAGLYAAPQGRDYPPHQHSVWELVYYRSGSIPCPIGDELYQSQPGMLLLTPPFTLHAEQAVEAYSNIFIAVDAPAEHPWPRMHLDDTRQTLGNLCSAIASECEGHESDSAEMVQVLMQQLDILLRRAYQQPLSTAEQLVRKVERMIAERLSNPVTIKVIAQEVGVSPSYLRAQFAQLRPWSPMEYLQEVRLNQALMLLRSSTSNLATIAAICGYDSPSHLSRYVKRATGKSPGAVRNDEQRIHSMPGSCDGTAQIDCVGTGQALTNMVE